MAVSRPVRSPLVAGVAYRTVTTACHELFDLRTTLADWYPHRPELQLRARPRTQPGLGPRLTTHRDSAATAEREPEIEPAPLRPWMRTAPGHPAGAVRTGEAPADHERQARVPCPDKGTRSLARERQIRLICARCDTGLRSQTTANIRQGEDLRRSAGNPLTLGDDGRAVFVTVGGQVPARL
jgi:hypothetical protein